MTDQNSKVSDREIDEFGEHFSKRYVLKKKVNSILCFFITFCGVIALLYPRFIFNNPFFDRLRYMTFWDTILASGVSLISGIVCIVEATRDTEVTYRQAYFIRLSAAATETVIFVVAMVSVPVYHNAADSRAVVPFLSVAHQKE